MGENKMFLIHKDGKPFYSGDNNKFATIYSDKKFALHIAKSENTRQANATARENEEFKKLHYTLGYPLQMDLAEKLAKETWKCWEVVKYVPVK